MLVNKIIKRNNLLQYIGNTCHARKCYSDFIDKANNNPIYLALDQELLHLRISDNLTYSLLPGQCRENCRCDLCTLKPSRHRNANNTILTSNELNNIYIKHAGIDRENKYIYLKWSDNHEGYIDLNELLLEDNTNIIADTSSYRSWSINPETITMDNQYNEIMFNDENLLSFYNELQLNGICLIRNCTATEGTAITIAHRLASHVYPTVFGNSFCVEIKGIPRS